MPADLPLDPTLSEMNYLLEAAVFVVYLVFLAGVGFVMKRFNTNSDDYFRSGARTTWWLMGPSLMMSMTSAAVFTATAGALYEAGLPVLASNFAQILTGIILASFLAAWFRQTRAITGPR
jgi:solute:Na+ symporter, SSS family